MNDDAPSMQNDFFNRARRETQPVTIYLTNGKKLSGRIKSFDRFTVILQSNRVDQMIFKHAISTVCVGAGPPERPVRRDARGERPHGEEQGPEEHVADEPEHEDAPAEEER